MTRTYSINGTSALKARNTRGHEVIELSGYRHAGQVQEARKCLFDKNLSVQDVLDNAQGYALFADRKDRIVGALTGLVSVAVFFAVSFITCI